MPVSDRDVVRAALGEAADLHRRVSAEQADAIVQAARMMRRAIEAGHKVLVFGNGGSATDAQHFAAELVGRFARDRKGLPVVALTTDPAILTAVSNDFGFDHVFSRQVEALGRAGDVAMGITTSGTSANVNRGLERARVEGLKTIGLTGRDGGDTGRLVDLHVNVPMQKVVTDRLRPAGRNDTHGVEDARRRLGVALGMVDQDMATKTWVMGDDFTMADCAAAPPLFYANILMPFGDTHTNAAAYLGRLTERPSFARAVKEAQPYLALMPK